VAEHKFCPCWGPLVALHDGHCCFREDVAPCPGVTEAEWQAAIDRTKTEREAR
jgi:hypothetical protein